MVPASDASPSDPSRSAELVIVGAGIAACALTARLRQQGWRGVITLVEAGRGVGGRAASRPSRQDPSWRLDHGAPFLDLNEADPPRLLQDLKAIDRLRPWPQEAQALQQLQADGRLSAEAGPLATGRLYRGWPAMADLALGMLELAETARQPGGPAAGAAALRRLHGVRVEGVERSGDQWVLRDSGGDPIAQGQWLILSGTLLAHPRCIPLLGCREVPLVAANRSLRDPALERALTAMEGLRYDPRLALLLRLEAGQAGAWRALPWRHLMLSEAARQRWGLERILVQPSADGRLGVVAQARPEDLVEAGLLPAPREPLASAMAISEPGPSARSQSHTSITTNHHTRASEREEREIIEALSQGLLDALGHWIQAEDLPPREQRQMMRWGGAFPLTPGLDREEMICTNSRVAFCGDALSGPGFGRIEGAWRSGEWLAERLLPLLIEADTPSEVDKAESEP